MERKKLRLYIQKSHVHSKHIGTKNPLKLPLTFNIVHNIHGPVFELVFKSDLVNM